jgi:hypothetical protein
MAVVIICAIIIAGIGATSVTVGIETIVAGTASGIGVDATTIGTGADAAMVTIMTAGTMAMRNPLHGRSVTVAVTKDDLVAVPKRARHRHKLRPANGVEEMAKVVVAADVIATVGRALMHRGRMLRLPFRHLNQ